MTIRGYSDRINHAFAFAAKHHDKQVRKGTALPYLTHPANVALILTRYGQDEDTVLAGILHEVVGDCVREGHGAEDLTQRIGDKFGMRVLEIVISVTERKLDDDGVEMSWDERKADFLDRIQSASDAGRWVCAADRVHNGGSILADLKRTAFPESIWGRFNRGREGTIHSFRQVYDRLAAVGFAGEIMDELREVVEALEAIRSEGVVRQGLRD